MKIMTVAGTRPELIRLSRVIPALDNVCEHTFVWTGQNYDPLLSDLFFEELSVRAPDGVMFTPDMSFASSMDWTGSMIGLMPKFLEAHKPDKVLVLGDTNSALSAFVAKRMGIPVFHMEAGNRCYDDRVPEEINRRVIDACSDVLLPYTNRSRDNLLAEGYPARRIYVTGNPIWEVLSHFGHDIYDSGAMERLGLSTRRYFLVTAHRQENVDDEARLADLVESLVRVADKWDLPVVVSTHPRTRAKLDAQGVKTASDKIRWLAPLGFFDFVKLERSAFCVLSDSGTVQEECCILGVPCVTLRDVTERPETVECGSNLVSGVTPDSVLRCVEIATNLPRDWCSPEGYMAPKVSSRVVKILLSKGV